MLNTARKRTRSKWPPARACIGLRMCLHFHHRYLLPIQFKLEENHRSFRRHTAQNCLLSSPLFMVMPRCRNSASYVLNFIRKWHLMFESCRLSSGSYLRAFVLGAWRIGHKCNSKIVHHRNGENPFDRGNGCIFDFWNHI